MVLIAGGFRVELVIYYVRSGFFPSNGILYKLSPCKCVHKEIKHIYIYIIVCGFYSVFGFIIADALLWCVFLCVCVYYLGVYENDWRIYATYFGWYFLE